MASHALKECFTLYSTAGKYEILPAAAKTIIGEYIEDGENHGRKVYRRQNAGQRGASEVILFYWDDKTGNELSGWWFGNKLGGGSVWAHSKESGKNPPQQSWRCPVDGPILKFLICEPTANTKDVVVDRQDTNSAQVNLPWMQKRPLSDGATAPPAKRQGLAVAQQPLVLASSLGDDAPAGVKKVLGEYVLQEGMNHGKKTFLKQGSEDEPIWLYYWDARDGYEFSGWWLGSHVGGALVYARAQQHSPQPAVHGWKIPHDGAVRRDVTLKRKDMEEEADMADDERVRKAKDMVKNLEDQAEEAIKTATKVLERPDVLDEGVRAACALLTSRAAATEEGKATIARHTKAAKRQKASNEAEAELTIMEERLQVLSGSISKHLDQAQERLRVIDGRIAEEHDSRALEVALPLAVELTTQAEMAAEAITAPEAVGKARELLNRARAKVTVGLRDARAFAPEARAIALKEFGELQERNEATARRLDVWISKKAGDAEEGWAAEFTSGAGKDDENDEADAGLNLDSFGSPEERLELLSEKVAEAEDGAKQALETSEVVFRDGADAQGMELCRNFLNENVSSAARLQRSLTKEIHTASRRLKQDPKVPAGLKELVPRLKAVRKQLSDELAKAKVSKGLAQKGANAVLAFEGDIEENVGRAEEAVEVATVAAADLAWRRAQVIVADEQGREFRDAVDNAQALVDRAQDAITSARAQVDVRIRGARAAAKGEIQREGLAKIAPLRNRLVNAQKRLNPHRHVRQDFDEHLKAKQGLASLKSKLVALETDVANLARALAEPMETEKEVASAEASLEAAQTGLADVLELIEPQRKQAAATAGPFQDAVTGFQERSQSARHRLEELRQKTSEQRKALATRMLVGDARREASAVEEFLEKVAEAEAPWEGHEVLPKAKADSALSMASNVVIDAEPAVQHAKAALTEQLIEAKTIPEDLVRLKTVDDLQTLLAKVDAVSLKVTQLKINTFARKTKMLFPEAVGAVAQAETKVKAAVEAVAQLSDDNLETISAADLKKIVAKFKGPSDAATKACAAAKAALEAKQKDPKYWGSPSYHTQLTKLSNRLDAVEGELSALKVAARDAEQNRSKTLKAQKESLAKIEKKVSQVEVLALPLGDERSSDASDESTATAVQDAQDALTAWVRAAEKFRTDPHGSMRLAMDRVREEAVKIQARLDEVKETTREERERGMCRLYVREGLVHVREVEAAVEKADAAEGPFLKGIEVLDADLTSRTVAACEEAGAAAKDVVKKAREFFLERVAAVDAFKAIDLTSFDQAKELKQLQKRVLSASDKLAQFTDDTEARKKKARRA